MLYLISFFEMSGMRIWVIIYHSSNPIFSQHHDGCNWPHVCISLCCDEDGKKLDAVHLCLGWLGWSCWVTSSAVQPPKFLWNVKLMPKKSLSIRWQPACTIKKIWVFWEVDVDSLHIVVLRYHRLHNLVERVTLSKHETFVDIFDESLNHLNPEQSGNIEVCPGLFQFKSSFLISRVCSICDANHVKIWLNTTLHPNP